MSAETRAVLSAAIDAHMRDEFPGDHDEQHLTDWAVVGCYESFDDTGAAFYSADGAGKNHATTGLLMRGIKLLDIAEDD